MIFVSSESKKFNLEALFFKIFKIPTVKVCSVKEIPPNRTDFTEDILWVFQMDEKILIR